MRDIIAELCHKQWSEWMKYVFGCCPYREDGTVAIPKWAVDRWKRQMETNYEDLPLEEKESDRKEADKFIKVFDAVWPF